MRAFIIVPESASSIRASELLHLSQLTLSYSRKLEELVELQLLGARIAERPPAGQHFPLQARRMIQDMDDAVRDARTVALTQGVIRLGTLPTEAASFLPGRWPPLASCIQA